MTRNSRSSVKPLPAQEFWSHRATVSACRITCALALARKLPVMIKLQ